MAKTLIPGKLDTYFEYEITCCLFRNWSKAETFSGWRLAFLYRKRKTKSADPVRHLWSGTSHIYIYINNLHSTVEGIFLQYYRILQNYRIFTIMLRHFFLIQFNLKLFINFFQWIAVKIGKIRPLSSCKINGHFFRSLRKIFRMKF